MPKKTREIRRVSGNDPVLDISAYRQWEDALPTICGIDKKEQIFICLCKKTIEAVKGGTPPPTIDQLLQEVPMGKSTLKEYVKCLRREGFVDQMGSGSTFWYRSTVKGLERYAEQYSDKT